jgi:hypothetical protein
LSIRIRVFFVVFVLSFFAFDLFLSSFSSSFSGALFDSSPPPGTPAAVAGAVLDFELSRRLEVRAHVCRITLPHVGRDLDVDEDAEDEDNVEMSTFSLPATPTAGASSSICVAWCKARVGSRPAALFTWPSH